MFSDEKGYLVTELVYEEVTDDEEESTAKPAAEHKAPSHPSVAAAPAKPKPASAPAKKKSGGPPQKGIGSFFGAKK